MTSLIVINYSLTITTIMLFKFSTSENNKQCVFKILRCLPH